MCFMCFVLLCMCFMCVSFAFDVRALCFGVCVCGCVGVCVCVCVCLCVCLSCLICVLDVFCGVVPI